MIGRFPLILAFSLSNNLKPTVEFLRTEIWGEDNPEGHKGVADLIVAFPQVCMHVCVYVCMYVCMRTEIWGEDNPEGHKGVADLVVAFPQVCMHVCMYV